MERDPIATPTLARLYLGQGHLDRARAVLDDCLARDPWDGHALALRDRLAARSEAVLTISQHDDELRLVWNGLERVPHTAVRPVVVLVAITQAGAPIATWVTSTPCGAAFGTWDVGVPFARGSACACIGCVRPGRGFAVLAVARPLSWP